METGRSAGVEQLCKWSFVDSLPCFQVFASIATLADDLDHVIFDTPRPTENLTWSSVFSVFLLERITDPECFVD